MYLISSKQSFSRINKNQFSYFIFLILILFSSISFGSEREKPLAPIKTASPKETMKTFIEAMNQYREGVDRNNPKKKSEIYKAIRTLDLSNIPQLVKNDTGIEAAIYLKEAIDRAIAVNYSYIPPSKKEPKIPEVWRLKDTEITIEKMTTGDRTNEYLFNKETVNRAKEFYEKIKHLKYVKGSGKGAGYEEPWLEQSIPEIFKGQIFGVPNWQLIGMLIALILAFFVKYFTSKLIKIFGNFAAKTKVTWDDKIFESIDKPLALIATSIFLYFCMKVLKLDGIILNIASFIIQATFSFALIWIFYRLSDIICDYIKYALKLSDYDIDAHIMPIVSKTLKIVVVIFGGLITFQNMGINVLSLMAGLGLGGLAFALAAKDTAANLFGSLMIFSDRPFRIGDWVKFNDVEGTVEEIGFRSTKLRTFYNSQITVPNSMVASETIDNLGRRQYRRINTTLGVTYDTSPEKIEAFLEGIKNIIFANKTTRKDYFHVVFSGFGDSSLNIMIYFFLKVPDWSHELVERQNIYLEIVRLAQKMDVSFAFPSKSLYIESMPNKDEKQSKMENLNRSALIDYAKNFKKEGTDSKPEGLGIYTPPFREN